MFRDRRTKKREVRKLWIQQINAGTRLYGIKYSQFIHGLNEAKVTVDRKILSELAMFEPYSFRALTKVATDTGVVEIDDGKKMIILKKSSSDLT